MNIEDYKKKAKQEQQNQEEIMKLEKEVQDWQAKSYESAKEIIALKKMMNKKKEVSLRTFIKQKELEYTENGDDIILSITGTPTEKLCFIFRFTEKRNEFNIVQDGKIIKTIVFTYFYANYPKFSKELYSDTGSKQYDAIKAKKKKIEISKNQIKQDKTEKEFILKNNLLIKIQGANPDYNKLYTDDEFWEEIFKTQ